MPRIHPIGGTRSTLFQLKRSFGVTEAEALFPYGEGFVYLEPVDLGAQVTYLVELREGEPARMHFLSALASTEITTTLPGLGAQAEDPYRTTADFMAGRWNELVTDRGVLEEDATTRRLTLELERVDGRLVPVER